MEVLPEPMNDRGLKLGRKILLKHQSHILSEMKTIYRLAARGRIKSSEAGTLVRILKAMREALLSSELEQRVAELEQEVAERRREPRGPVVATNGHGEQEEVRG